MRTKAPESLGEHFGEFVSDPKPGTVDIRSNDLSIKLSSSCWAEPLFSGKYGIVSPKG